MSKMIIDVLTIFPKMFHHFLKEGIISQAQKKGLVKIRLHNIRDYATDKHRRVDDYPFGGGPGMVMKPEPIARALKHIGTDKVIFLTPQGRPFNQSEANKLSLEKSLLFLCGRYKGVDERVRVRYVTDEISIGDYALAGGELAAMVVIEAVVRLIPGVLKDSQSALEDSFQENLLDCPWYTRPREFEGMKVPDILLSGDHLKIKQWRKKEALKRTQLKRPNLLRRRKDATRIVSCRGLTTT